MARFVEEDFEEFGYVAQIYYAGSVIVTDDGGVVSFLLRLVIAWIVTIRTDERKAECVICPGYWCEKKVWGEGKGGWGIPFVGSLQLRGCAFAILCWVVSNQGIGRV